MQVNLNVDTNYILDLHDDFVMNKDNNLYEFIGTDPVLAFYLGANFKKWFEELEKEQQYLYSKQARHNKEHLEKYENQIQFWTKKYPDKKDGVVDLIPMSEYILNNMFYDEDSEELDKVKLAFFLGNLAENETSEDNN